MVVEIAQSILDNCPEPSMDDPWGASFWEYYGKEVYQEHKKNSWPDELVGLDLAATLSTLWGMVGGGVGTYYEWYSILNDLSEDPLFGKVFLDVFEEIADVEDSDLDNAQSITREGWHNFLRCAYWPEKTEDLVVNRWISGYYMDDCWEADFGSRYNDVRIYGAGSQDELLVSLMDEIELYGKEKILRKVRHEIFLISSPRIQPIEGEFRRDNREERMDKRQVALEELEIRLVG